jgi:hypothetical protein
VADHERRAILPHRDFDLRDLFIEAEFTKQHPQFGKLLSHRRVQHFAARQIGNPPTAFLLKTDKQLCFFLDISHR